MWSLITSVILAVHSLATAPWGSGPAGFRGTKFYFVDVEVSPLFGCQAAEWAAGSAPSRPEIDQTSRDIRAIASLERLQLSARHLQSHFCVIFLPSTSSETPFWPRRFQSCRCAGFCWTTAVDLKKAAARSNLSPSPPFPAPPHYSHAPGARLATRNRPPCPSTSKSNSPL